jgi:hypothetical protein
MLPEYLGCLASTNTPPYSLRKGLANFLSHTTVLLSLHPKDYRPMHQTYPSHLGVVILTASICLAHSSYRLEHVSLLLVNYLSA